MGFFSALFGTADNTKLTAVVSEGAFLVDVRSCKWSMCVQIHVSEGAFLVDVRSPGEFASGSVPGAVNIPLDQVQQQIAKFKGKKNIVVFCRSGNRSSMAKSILAKNGYTDVVDGGTWQNVNKIITNL